MNKLILSYRAALIFSIGMLFCGFSQAQQLSQYNAAKIQRAIQLQQEQQLSEAIEVLAKLTPSQDYDRAYINRMLGVFHWQQGNTPMALSFLDKAVMSKQLDDEQARVTQRMLADLWLTEQGYSQALSHYYQLTKNMPKEQKTNDLWFRIAQAHYQLSEWDKVLIALKQQQHLSKHSHQILVLKLGAQLQLKQWNLAIPTLNALLEIEPRQAGWWQQLANVQLRLNKSSEALDTLALARRQGIELNQSELMLLAQLYAQRGIPEKAAQVVAMLKDAETDKQLLVTQASYWQAAKEWDKAITIWLQAAKLDAVHYWPAAQLQIQEGYHQQGLATLDKVTEYSKTADVALAKVRAYYKLNQIDKALMYAKRANEFESSSTAKGWIQYLSQLKKISANKDLT